MCEDSYEEYKAKWNTRAFLSQIPYSILITKYNGGCTQLAKWGKFLVVPMSDMGAEYSPLDNIILCSYTSEHELFKTLPAPDVSIVDIKDVLPEQYHKYLKEDE